MGHDYVACKIDGSYRMSTNEQKVLSKHEIRRAVMAQCTKGPDGVWYRMIIPQVTCRSCGKDRYQDGCKCPICGMYQSPDVGAPVPPELTGSASPYLSIHRDGHKSRRDA